MLSIIVGLAVILAFGSAGDRTLVLAIGAISISAGVTGLLEDVRGLPIAIRASAQLVIGVGGAVLLGVTLTPPWWFIALGAVLIAAYINIANFMDGLNGISGLYGLVTGVTYGLIGLALGMPWLSTSGFVLAVAFLFFLPWNLSRPGLFLGDVGSYLLGALVASLAVVSAMAGAPTITAMAPLAIYLGDTIVTLVRRGHRGEPILRPHRTHAYQRLTDTGLTHVQASTLVTCFTITTSAVGMLVIWINLHWAIATLLVLIVVSVYLVIPRLRGSKLPMKPLLHLRDAQQPTQGAPREGFRPVRWVVLGASGFVGSALRAQLDAAGYDTVTSAAPRLRLEPTDANEVAASHQSWSDEQFETLVRTFDGADVVVNAAGLATPDAPADADLYGANVLLPALVAQAAASVGVARVIHLSSAAVQGRRAMLDETLSASPFSPYSHSKALGERAFFGRGKATDDTDLIVIRATSVQGRGRRTTESFRRVARSRLASVAAPGTQPTVVSSIDGLVDFIRRVGASTASVGPIMLQPWEGHSVRDVLRAAGGSPRVIPRGLCLVILAGVRAVGRVIPEIAGAGRRLEMMWLGQAQSSAFETSFPAVPEEVLKSVLEDRESVS